MHGVRCGGMTPFKLKLNEENVTCKVKILNPDDQWTPAEDTKVRAQFICLDFS